MPQLHSPEISESKKPLVLVYTNDKFLQSLFYKEFSKKLSILFVSESTPANTDATSYHIKTSEVHLITQLEETINYAIVFVTEQKDKNNIDSLFTKLKNDNTKSVLLIPANSYNDYVDVLLSAKNITNIIPAVVGDTLENPYLENELLKIIRIALSNEKVKLSGNDLYPIFPISKDDLVIGVKQLLFSNKSRALYYLFYKKPETLLSAVHLLARLEPELKFEIDHDNIIERYEERGEMNQILTDKLQLRIEHLDKHFKGFDYAIEHLQIDPREKMLEAKIVEKKGRPFPKFRRFNFNPSVSLALFYSLMLFIVINMIFGVVGLLFLRSSIQAFENQDFLEAKEKGLFAKNSLGISMPTLNVIESTISYFPFLNKTYETLHLVTTTANLTTVSAELINHLDSLGEGINENDLEKILQNASYLYHSGSRVILSQSNRAITTLLKPNTTKTLSIMPVVPILLGYKDTQEYLILFMNNAELRPTGGFIGSVGRLVIEKGKIKEFVINDVYDFDGQLKRHIEPHYIVRRHLQPHLYLRDSNFDLDFERSATTSAMIYNLESGNTVDGVVAIDFNVVKKILEIIGPVKLNSYDETITSDNSMDFLQSTIDEGFFPGSTQKKDLLNDLFKTIVLKLEQNPEYYVKIGLSLPELLDEKHILLSYQKPEIQSLLSALNYSGNVPYGKNDDNAIYDTVGFNEANIGVNKVNKNVSRSINYDANLANRTSKAKITLRNDSKTDDYKVFLRLISPKNSVFRDLRVDNIVVETIPAVKDFRIYERNDFNPDQSVYELDTEIDYDKTVFGTIITVPRNRIMTIEFEYTNPKLFIEDGINNYELNVIKQPGTDITPSKFTLRFPNGYNATGEKLESFGDGYVNFESDLKSDLNYRIKFSKE